MARRRARIVLGLLAPLLFACASVPENGALLGMTLGSILLAPLADVIGRRKLMLACIVVMSAGVRDDLVRRLTDATRPP